MAVKKKKKSGFCYCETWKMNYWFFLGWSEKDFEKEIKRVFNYDVQHASRSDGLCLRCYHGNSTIKVIWTRRKTDYGSLMHECIHAAGWTLEDVGVDIRDSNSEPLAYLAQSIFEKATGK